MTFQDLLKAEALTFLERHHCEHLGNDKKLFDRAVQHLVSQYCVTAQIAEPLVHLASTDMAAICDRQRLDVGSCTATHTVITDPSTGHTWAIPVSLIYERIINAPDNGRYRITNS
ncbi:hypothetical protein V2J95_05240 [Pseudomonas alliivorans]|nr:hypothetical protein [Pseudomonas alliivorans]